MSFIERETKLVLSLEDYERLRARGRTLECRDQLNVYLHDPLRLKEELGYFRVRFESGRVPVATLKIPVGWRGEMREMVEVEAPLSELGPALYPWPHRWVSVGAGVPGEFKEHLQALGIRRLRRLGWMRNHRLVLDLEGTGTVELDRTRLPNGTVHYEVEVETPREDLHLALVERVRSIVPSAAFSRIGKFSRFLSALTRDSNPS
jgi:uncharacterized protein YjbK